MRPDNPGQGAAGKAIEVWHHGEPWIVLAGPGATGCGPAQQGLAGLGKDAAGKPKCGITAGPDGAGPEPARGWEGMLW